MTDDQPAPRERMDDEDGRVTEHSSLLLHMKVDLRATTPHHTGAADEEGKKKKKKGGALCFPDAELDVIAPEPSECWFPL